MNQEIVRTKKQCSEKVYPNDRWGAFHSYTCTKTAIVERAGKWYCKIHDPEYKKKKDAQRSKQWNEKWDKESRINSTKAIALDACIKINPENPQAVAESIRDMYEALKAVQSSVVCNGDMTTSYAIDGKIAKQIQQALSKAEDK